MHKLESLPPGQEGALETLKRLLGDLDYLICPLSAEYQRSRWDYIAYQKQNPRKFLIIRPTPAGWVSLTPFLLKIHYGKLFETLKSCRTNLGNVRLYWSKKQVGLLEGTDGWVHYFPPELQRHAKAT